MRYALPMVLLLLSGCDATQSGSVANAHGESKPVFPKADRPVATIVSARWSTEESRDRLNEAELVMDKAGIASGMTVADIGAGEGYYTIRLAQRVGDDGRVLAEDIIPQIRDALAQRLIALLTDSALAKQLGAAGRAWVEAEWRWETQATRLSSLLE